MLKLLNLSRKLIKEKDSLIKERQKGIRKLP